MKNKKTLFIFLFSLFLILSKNKIFSEETKVEFSISPEFGLLNGKIVENVWNADMIPTNTGYIFEPTTKRSRLDWQINNTPYIGATIHSVFERHLVLNFNFMSAIKRSCGIMEDYDWNPNQPDHLTNYSYHKNYLKSLSQINLNIGYAFNINKLFPISISPLLGIEIFNFVFSGRGGYRTYETENWEIKRYPDDKIVIDYEQSYVSPRLGLLTDFDFSRFFETKIHFFVSYINTLNAYDSHEIRSVYWHDELRNLWKFDARMELIFKINKSNHISFIGCINYIPDAFGFTYKSFTSKDDFPSNPVNSALGGTNRFLWSYGLSYIFKFVS